MKTPILLALICIVLMMGCNNVPNPQETNSSWRNSYDYRIVIIDSCEYIYMGGAETQTITHKGNCKNPVHHTEYQDLKLQKVIPNGSLKIIEQP